ncbi:MAG: 1,4-dihydroxy-2-naphthoate polyprenyltransferase [Bacteroidetes bacterium]|nr:MAG: 1,4-dihydroxy-2-naphthoate polyprenyltransferase [Bacteroidota bacterium]
MGNTKAWIEAARLKTLPLAVSSPLMGSFLAWSEGSFQWSIFTLATITTLLLQILSNLANDYGDFASGADNEERVGPRRLVQSGLISTTQMKKGIVLNIILALISGLLLIWFGAGGKDAGIILIFLVLGISAIVAAIKYTVGKNPYGYRGLGDISVFMFFGLIGVLGTHFLHTGTFNPWHALPAAAIGLLSAGVLNLNNLRDYESDKKAHKRTLVVWLGNQRAKYYHLGLIVISAILGPLYVIFNYHSAYQFLFILAFPLFFRNAIAVFRYNDPMELYPELKRLALATLVFAITFGIGMVI